MLQLTLHNNKNGLECSPKFISVSNRFISIYPLNLSVLGIDSIRIFNCSVIGLREVPKLRLHSTFFVFFYLIFDGRDNMYE